MIGTIVNTATILTGSLIGSEVKKGIREEYQEGLFHAMGLAAVGLRDQFSGAETCPKPVSGAVYCQPGGGQPGGDYPQCGWRFQKLTGKFRLRQPWGGALHRHPPFVCIGTLSIPWDRWRVPSMGTTPSCSPTPPWILSPLVLASTYGVGIALAAVFPLLAGEHLPGGGDALRVSHPELLTEISVVGGFLIASSGLSILKIQGLQNPQLAACPVGTAHLLPGKFAGSIIG